MKNQMLIVSAVAAACLSLAAAELRKDFRIRDPFVLTDNGTYYLYESKPWFGGNGVSVRTSTDLEHWSEKKPAMVVPAGVPVTAVWAPEVHKYEGAYYLFTTLTEEKGSAPIQAMNPKAKEGHLMDPRLDKFFASKFRRARGEAAAFVASVYAWIKLKQDDEQAARAALTAAKNKSDHPVLLENHEKLVNGKAKQFSNAGFGDMWYALFLEEPKMKPQRQRQGRPF